MSDAWVYFVKHPVSGLIKVGYSANPERRIRELDAAAGCRLEVLAVLPGDRVREQRFHGAMAAFRDHGEWFKPNTLIDACVALSEARAANADGWEAKLLAMLRLEHRPERIVASAEWPPDAATYWGEWLELLAPAEQRADAGCAGRAVG